MSAVTKEQITAVVRTIAVVAELIRELGEVPSGHLYAQLMDQMGLLTYDRVIDQLKRAKLVSESNHVLRWIGPPAAAKKE